MKLTLASVATAAAVIAVTPSADAAPVPVSLQVRDATERVAARQVGALHDLPNASLLNRSSDDQHVISKLTVRNWTEFFSKVGGCFELFCNPNVDRQVSTLPELHESVSYATVPEVRTLSHVPERRISYKVVHRHSHSDEEVMQRMQYRQGKLKEQLVTTKSLGDEHPEILRLFKKSGA